MGAERTGLTLEGLAKKLETQAQKLQTLERENERMRSENAELRGKVATLEGPGARRNELAEMKGSGMRRDGEPVPAFEGRVSRRSLLSKAGAAAVAAVAAGTLLNPRHAKAHGMDDDPISPNYVYTHWLEAVTHDHITEGGFAIRGTYNGGTGVWGRTSRIGYGGVYGQHTGSMGYGVIGDGNGEGGAGVIGKNGSGVGVEGRGKNGVYGLSPTGDGWAAVVGRSTGQGGTGTYGECTGEDGIGAYGGCSDGTGVVGEGFHGVEGKASSGSGVYGQSTSGTGVRGYSLNGYGGSFRGGSAQLKLQTGSTRGEPTTGPHQKGEIYMDSNATLFVCTQTGIPGKWRRVQTAAT